MNTECKWKRWLEEKHQQYLRKEGNVSKLRSGNGLSQEDGSGISLMIASMNEEGRGRAENLKRTGKLWNIILKTVASEWPRLVVLKPGCTL